MYQLHLESMRKGDYLMSGKAMPIMYVPPGTNQEVVAIVINVVLLIVLVLSVGVLTGFQVYYAMTNVTTIESMENDKIVELMKKGRIPRVAAFPYDLGWYRNVCQVLGPKWYFWLIPQRQDGDGRVFPINENLVNEGKAILWPPEEYYEYRRDPYGLSRKSRYELDDNVTETDDDTDPGDYSGNDDDASSPHHHASQSTNYSERKPGQSSSVQEAVDMVQNRHDDDVDVPLTRTKRGRKMNSRHIRRGSEGYVVREFTSQERERMVRAAFEKSHIHTSNHNESQGHLVENGMHDRPSLIQMILSDNPAGGDAAAYDSGSKLE